MSVELEAYHFHEEEWDSYRELYDAFEWEVPETFNVGEYICDRWVEDGDRIALYAENEAGERDVYTYQDLRDISNQVANFLAREGVTRGDRVALNLPQRAETILCYIACWKLGAVTTPLSTLFGPEGLEFRLQDAGATACIVDESNVSELRQVLGDLSEVQTVVTVGDVEVQKGESGLWKSIQDEPTDFNVPRTEPEDDLLLMYTSGTTGRPKGVRHTHRFVLGHLPSFLLIFSNMELDDEAVFWSPSEWAWVAFFDYVIPPLFYGKTVLSYNGGPFEPETAARLIDDYDVTNLFIPPTALRMMRDGYLEGFSLESVDVIASGGEPLGQDIVAWVAETFGGAALNQAYGQTEANLLIGTCDALMVVPPNKLGKAMPGHEVEIRDQYDPSTSCEPEIIGEIAVRYEGDLVCMKEYWNRPDATENKVRDGWLLTEDLGTIDDNGVFTFNSRKDDVIISAGYRIGPSEIEETLAGHEAVTNAGVIGIPDDERGEVPKAFVVLSSGYERSDDLRKTLSNYVKNRLAKYEYPREIEFVDELPKTATGKIRRLDLQRREERNA